MLQHPHLQNSAASTTGSRSLLALLGCSDLTPSVTDRPNLPLDPVLLVVRLVSTLPFGRAHLAPSHVYSRGRPVHTATRTHSTALCVSLECLAFQSTVTCVFVPDTYAEQVSSGSNLHISSNASQAKNTDSRTLGAGRLACGYSLSGGWPGTGLTEDAMSSLVSAGSVG